MQAVFSLAIVLGVLVAISIAGGPPTEEMKKIAEECKVQEGGTDEDVQMLMGFKMPQSPNGKCFLACVYERNGKIKDGKVNGEALKAAFIREHGGDERAAGSEVIAACQSIINPQRCDLAFQLMDCLQKSMAKNGHGPK